MASLKTKAIVATALIASSVILSKDRHSNGVCPGSEVLEAKIKVAVRSHPCEESLGWDR